MVLARGVALKVAAIISVGYRPAQLVLAALICSGSAVKAAYALPYYDLPNAMLDVWYGVAAATSCLVTAALASTRSS